MHKKILVGLIMVISLLVGSSGIVQAVTTADRGLVVLIKTSGIYSNADLSGTWDLKSMYASGTVTADGTGNITGGSYVNEEGTTYTVTDGTYSVSADGTFTAHIITNLNEFDIEGAMNQSKDIIACVDTEIDDDDRGLVVLIKTSGIYSNADLSGTWDLKGMYASGTVTSDGAGNITGGSYVDDQGTTETITGGTYSVNVDGTFTAHIITDLKEFDSQGAMNQSKDIIACVDSDDGDGDDGDGDDGDGGGGGGGGDCFIATACFGTPMAEEVRALSEFRDECLLTNPVGKIFVRTYYKVSPPVADFIKRHSMLKNVVRRTLKPIVWVARELEN